MKKTNHLVFISGGNPHLRTESTTGCDESSKILDLMNVIVATSVVTNVFVLCYFVRKIQKFCCKKACS